LLKFKQKETHRAGAWVRGELENIYEFENRLKHKVKVKFVLMCWRREKVHFWAIKKI
jgi:hypothetical protein